MLGFLGGFLPGIREVRTPLAAGALILVLMLLAHSGAASTRVGSPLHRVETVIDQFGAGARSAALVLLAFLLGLAWRTVQDVVFSRALIVADVAWFALREWASYAAEFVARPVGAVSRASSQTRLDSVHLLRDIANYSPRAKALARDYLRGGLEENLPAIISKVPSSYVLDDLPISAAGAGEGNLRVADAYSRLSAEAEFRRAIAMPAGASAALGLHYWADTPIGWSAVAGALACIVLFYAARRSAFDAQVLAASRLGKGGLRARSIESLSAYAAATARKKKGVLTEVDQYALAINGIARNGGADYLYVFGAVLGAHEDEKFVLKVNQNLTTVGRRELQRASRVLSR